MAHGHFITICKKCSRVISQCRCGDPGKITKYAVCDDCQIEEMKAKRGGCRSCD